MLDHALAVQFGAEALKPESPLPEARGSSPIALAVTPGDGIDDPHAPVLPLHELEARRAQPALAGWRPDRLPSGCWGARYDAAELLPEDLVGRRIVVTDRRGRSEVLEVVERTLDTVLVRDRNRRQPALSGPRSPWSLHSTIAGSGRWSGLIGPAGGSHWRCKAV